MISLSDLRAHEMTLPNGLRVVAAAQPALHRVTIALYVGVGSRHEARETNGVSHFLEHMLYRGTSRLPSAHAQNFAFERLGGTLYASTHADHTVVEVSLPPKSTRDALAMISELVAAPRLGEIEIERGIVREEINEDLDEDGRQIDVDNVARTTMFGDHPLGFTITGDVATLDAFDEPLLRAHLQRFYVARNAVLAVAGACDPAEVFAWAAEVFGSWSPGDPSQFKPFERGSHGARRKHVSSHGSQTDLAVSFLTPGDRDPRAPAIEMLMRVLDDGMSTRLYHALCDAGGLVYDCSAAWEPFAECGVVDLRAEVQHARLVDVVSTSLDLVRELASQGPSSEELDKARDRHRWDLEAALDDPDALANLLGAAVLFDRPRSLDAMAARYDALKPADVAKVARTIFHPNRMVLTTVGTLSKSTREKLRALVRGYRVS